MPAPTPELVAAARRTLHYLATVDPTPSAPADAILGFGMFDLRLPVFCGELHRRGLAPRLIFTGGIGAGTGNLGRPEADAWHDALRRARPEIPATEVILESIPRSPSGGVAGGGSSWPRPPGFGGSASR
ncbi:MAG: hypothetical protein HZC55_05450 [Verrucomicrobia bacterium]|nr:hypothetical protein [Verrucomicrobiota bacterium]